MATHIVKIGVAALLSGLATASEAQEQRYAVASLVSEDAALVPGESTTLGLRFVIEPGWHVYWAGRNDTGFPVQAEWSVPAGYEVGELRWPVPKRHVLPGDILDYVYEKSVTLLAQVRVPPDAKPGETVTITADAAWLVCKEACLPEDALVTLTLPVVAAGTSPAPAAGAEAVRAARSRLPRRVEPTSDGPYALRWDGQTMVIEPAGAFAWAAFYPSAASMAVSDPIRTALVKRGPLRLAIDAGAPAESRRVTGMLEIDRGGASPSEVFWIDEALPGE